MYATISRLRFERFNYQWTAIHETGKFEKIPRALNLKMRNFSTALFKLILVASFLPCIAGCLPPLAIQSIGTATSGAPVAFNHLGGGKGESYWIARYDDVTRATMETAKALSLKVKEKKIEKSHATLRFSDDTDKTIDVFIERRTDTMTSIVFDVGWFGSVAFGRLFANQIIFELFESGAFLEDWTPAMHN
jgi:hypothetical protein